MLPPAAAAAGTCPLNPLAPASSSAAQPMRRAASSSCSPAAGRRQVCRTGRESDGEAALACTQWCNRLPIIIYMSRADCSARRRAGGAGRRCRVLQAGAAMRSVSGVRSRGVGTQAAAGLRSCWRERERKPRKAPVLSGRAAVPDLGPAAARRAAATQISQLSMRRVSPSAATPAANGKRDTDKSHRARAAVPRPVRAL